MREEAIRIGRQAGTDRERRNVLREYLQHVLLRVLFEARLLGELVFHGGTALRILHDLARFSEDLDFHTGAAVSGFDLADKVDELTAKIESNGYRVETKLRPEGNVQSCMFRFPDLLHDCDLSDGAEEKLRVKLEVDHNPPAGFATERTAVDRFFPFVVVHHNRPTFLAGKLHAILQRPFAKGRDFYDLGFYLRRWPEVVPNLEYLNAALRQTGYEGEEATASNWKDLVGARLREGDWVAIERDLAPFLLRSGDLEAFEREFLLRLL